MIIYRERNDDFRITTIRGNHANDLFQMETSTSNSIELAHQTTEQSHEKEIKIEWLPNDPQHPFNWSKSKKWLTAICALLFNSSTACNGTAYAAARTKGSIGVGVTETVWLLGMTTYLVPLAIAPLLLAPLTERTGRRPTCVIAMIIYVAMFLPQALVPKIEAILASRFVQGAAGSVGNTMVSATLTDLFPKEERLIPLAVVVWCVLTSQAIGSTASTWTVYDLRYEWVFWWLGCVGLGSLVLVITFLPETRHTKLLQQRANELTKRTGIKHFIYQGPIQAKSQFWKSIERMTRPCVFFFTEPIVATLALWVGFLWGVVFLSLEGIPIAMEPYGFIEPKRTSFLALMALGASLGLAWQPISLRHYRRAKQRNHNLPPPPEIRLTWCTIAACMTCGSLFLYAWTARRSIYPIIPAIGLIGFYWGVFEIYLSTLLYLADAYETYAASGIACQALMRNICSGTFPLFSTQFYQNLSPPIATSICATIAGILGIAPFLLIRFGPILRKRSAVAVLLQADEDQKRAVTEEEKV